MRRPPPPLGYRTEHSYVRPAKGPSRLLIVSVSVAACRHSFIQSTARTRRVVTRTDFSHAICSAWDVSPTCRLIVGTGASMSTSRFSGNTVASEPATTKSISTRGLAVDSESTDDDGICLSPRFSQFLSGKSPSFKLNWMVPYSG